MSSDKKKTRQTFRNAVFSRDKHRCRVCNWALFDGELKLDAHHITDRNLMPGGGYVVENGISLCPGCHEKAEEFHRSGRYIPGMSPDELYARIGSSYEEALEASKKIAPG